MNSGYFEDMRLIYVLLSIIVLLSAYIIYLNIRLINRNLYIRNIIKSITGEDREPDKNELRKLLAELHKFNLRANIRESKILEPKTLEFILGMEQERKIYLHYTMMEADARNIISEGFRFVESFYRTALSVTSDRLDLLMKHNDKRFYGDFVIVICISTSVVEKCSHLIENAGLRNYSFENMLTETPPVKNENSDMVFLLPSKYIKGYLNHRTGDIFLNKIFNPDFVTSRIVENIDQLARLESRMYNKDS
jgi:hypothetical protein